MIDIVNYNYKGEAIDVTSRSTTWSKGLSPFFIGPCKLYGDYVAYNMENAWQYSKVYKEYHENGGPSEAYFKWAEAGWRRKFADRYPMGKGEIPLYSYWDGDKLDYIEARKKIYIPLYAEAVQKTEAFKLLKDMYLKNGYVILRDFDGYDYRKLGYTLDEVINNPHRKMGHAFVLAMMLMGITT